jgi:hypothetical protein
VSSGVAGLSRVTDRRSVSVLSAIVLLASCGPIEDSSANRAERSTAGDPRASSGGEVSARAPGRTATVAAVANAVVRINDETESDASARVRPPSTVLWNLDAGPMVTADAGPRSAELAWLVTRIDENADTAGPAGAPNVRALASYGSDGVRALVAVFRAGDARRGPHARRAIELVAQRACRGTADRLAPRRIVAWLETGSTSLARQDAGDGAWPWARAAEARWPVEAVDRMRAWADQGIPCEPEGRAARTTMDAGAAVLDARAR